MIISLLIFIFVILPLVGIAIRKTIKEARKTRDTIEGKDQV